MKRKVGLSIIIALTLLLLPSIALAADADLTSADSPYDLSAHAHIAGDTITILNNQIVELTGTAPVGVKIVCNKGATLTLRDVIIDVSASNNCALSTIGKNITLIIEGASNLKSGNFEPGIKVEGTTSLEINGSGSIDVTCGDGGAGIGGGYQKSAGSITVSGGKVTAIGGVEGAGIGGGGKGDGGSIILSGGDITATGGIGAAGIGAGLKGASGSIKVSGAIVKAAGGSYGSGIGSGYNGIVNKIIITSGEVNAIGSVGGAGIGIGYVDSKNKSGTIEISGGTHTATGGDAGAGIGGGYNGAINRISITGGTITASGGIAGAGIGGGQDGEGGMMHISSSDITALGGAGGAGIGGGLNGHGGTINIYNATVMANSGTYAAGIGGGYASGVRTISISDSEVYATGDVTNGAQDIGVGDGGSGGKLRIGGDSAVFIEHEAINSLVPSIPYPTYQTLTGPGDVPPGYIVPPTWTYNVGLYRGTAPLFIENPQTGQHIDYRIFAVIVSIFVVVMVFVLIKPKQQN